MLVTYLTVEQRTHRRMCALLKARPSLPGLVPISLVSIYIPDATRTHLFSLAPLCLPQFLNGNDDCHDEKNKALVSAYRHSGAPQLLPQAAPRDPGCKQQRGRSTTDVESRIRVAKLRLKSGIIIIITIIAATKSLFARPRGGSEEGQCAAAVHRPSGNTDAATSRTQMAPSRQRRYTSTTCALRGASSGCYPRSASVA